MSIAVGDRVTNARGWYGIIIAIKHKTDSGADYLTLDGQYYMVWWLERATHDHAALRRQPFCGMTCEQIYPDDRPPHPLATIHYSLWSLDNADERLQAWATRHNIYGQTRTDILSQMTQEQVEHLSRVLLNAAA